MQLPWWTWALLSLAGFAGTALICTRLTTARVAPTTINVYLFTAGLLAFLLYAGLTKTDLRLPAEARWWLLPLALTVFASNYAVVTAYRLAPNVAYVKAVGVGELVLVTLVVAGVAWANGQRPDLSAWKLAGMGLCFVGAVLVAFDEKRPLPAPQSNVAVDETSPGSELRTIPVPSGVLKNEPAGAPQRRRNAPAVAPDEFLPEPSSILTEVLKDPGHEFRTDRPVDDAAK